MPSKILVVSAGGTIDSRTSGSVVSLASPGGVIDEYCRVRGKDRADYHCVQAAAVQSENMTLPLLRQIADCLFAQDISAYNGVTVTHGTDTLAFTASLLCALFAHVNIPMVITGSNLPPDAAGTDAFDNIALSEAFIKEGLPGVYVAFGGKIHLASRVGQSRHFVHDFTPLLGVPFAESDGNCGIRFIQSSVNPPLSRVRETRTPAFAAPPRLAAVKLITPYVGLDYKGIDISCCDAVLHGTYHTGSVNSADGAFAAFAERCAAADVPLFLGPLERDTVYGGQEELRRLTGVYPVYGMPTITAWGRLTAAAAVLRREELVRYMNEDIFFERI